MEQFVVRKKSAEGKAREDVLPRPDVVLGDTPASDTDGRNGVPEEHNKRIAATFDQVWDNPVPGEISFEGVAQRIVDALREQNNSRDSDARSPAK